MQTALFENLPIQFNADLARPDLPLFQLAECKARAQKQETSLQHAYDFTRHCSDYAREMYKSAVTQKTMNLAVKLYDAYHGAAYVPTTSTGEIFEAR